jgi:hypothetical protein
MRINPASLYRKKFAWCDSFDYANGPLAPNGGWEDDPFAIQVPFSVTSSAATNLAGGTSQTLYGLQSSRLVKWDCRQDYTFSSTFRVSTGVAGSAVKIIVVAFEQNQPSHISVGIVEMNAISGACELRPDGVTPIPFVVAPFIDALAHTLRVDVRRREAVVYFDGAAVATGTMAAATLDNREISIGCTVARSFGVLADTIRFDRVCVGGVGL